MKSRAQAKILVPEKSPSHVSPSCESARTAPFEDAAYLRAIPTRVGKSDTQRNDKKTEREQADVAIRNTLDLVVNAVRGTPGYGKDSGLYRSLGYVRQSERKSGLTRKLSIPPVVVTPAVADVA